MAVGYGFRNDIEGLRAVAVVPIVLFHLKSDLCPGGFIGVDVFFVISGYLISRMILAEGAGFSLKVFYIRRFFRIFPALIATLTASLVAGWWIQSPPEYDALARSAIAAAFGLSNFFFLASVSYFNPENLSHPLLHTWSLGLEEQFYLFWPLVLIGLRGSSRRPMAVLGLAALSCTAAILLRSNYPELPFYMMPFRIFEFAIGASCVFIEPIWRRLPLSMSNLTGAFGAGLLGYSFAALDGQTPWPGLATLVPTCGTALFIMSGQHGVWRTVLELGALRHVGRISFSLYLVHWPLIAFYRVYSIIEPTTVELLALLVLTIIVGELLYATVEIRCRIRSGKKAAGELAQLPELMSLPRPAVVSWVLATLVLCLLCAGTVVAMTGIPSRLNRSTTQFADKGLTFAGDLCGGTRSRCVFGDKNARKVVYLIGDSHALNLVHGLDSFFRNSGIKGIAFYKQGCLFVSGSVTFRMGVADLRCSRAIEEGFDYLPGNQEPVILAINYNGYRNAVGTTNASEPLRQSEDDYFVWLEDRLRASLNRLDAKNRTVVLVKQAYTTGVDVAKCLYRPSVSKDGKELCVALQLSDVQIRNARADSTIDALAKEFPSSFVVDPKLHFCSSEKCTMGTAESGLFFRDPDHLTNAGSDFLIEELGPKLRQVLMGYR